MQAPTPVELIAKHGDLTISCGPCRVLRGPIGLLDNLVAAGYRDRPIDQIVFRCHACGAIGQPMSRGPGNLLMGREQLWPPKTGS
jgi:hypothetical protein